MKKKILFLLISLLWVMNIHGQKRIEYSAGYGEYKMDDMQAALSSIMDNLTSQFPFDIAVISNFPSYINHNAGLMYQLNKHEFGANVGYLSTAGKIAYSDYSGEIMGKLSLNAYRIGLVYRYHVYRVGLSRGTSVTFYGELSPGIIFTKLKSKEHVIVNGQSKDIDNAYNVNSSLTGFSVLPQVGISMNLPYGFGIRVYGGYDIESGSNVKEKKVRRSTGQAFESGEVYHINCHDFLLLSNNLLSQFRLKISIATIFHC